MKKVFLFAAAAVLAVGFTSCKKEYKCACTTTVTDENGAVLSTHTVETNPIKATKSKAKESCEGLSKGDANIKISCAIK